tara:strand:- start:62446 stop:63237 length:792 start_codon:yes stop_codon:yes gene_type:complete
MQHNQPIMTRITPYYSDVLKNKKHHSNLLSDNLLNFNKKIMQNIINKFIKKDINDDVLSFYWFQKLFQKQLSIKLHKINLVSEKLHQQSINKINDQYIKYLDKLHNRLLKKQKYNKNPKTDNILKTLIKKIELKKNIFLSLQKTKCSHRKVAYNLINLTKILIKEQNANKNSVKNSVQNNELSELLINREQVKSFSTKEHHNLFKSLDIAIDKSQKSLGECTPEEQLLYRSILDVFKNIHALKDLSNLPDFTPDTERRAGLKF